MVKLASMINNTTKLNNKPVEFMSSKSRMELTSTRLLEHWTDEDIAQHFNHVVTPYDKVHFTMWISMPCFHNIWSFKIPILAFLKKNRMFVDRHSAPMHDVQMTDIGWYSNKHHPEAINTKQVQTELNDTIEKHFARNKESIIKWVNNTNGLQAWNGEYLSKVTITTVYPNWRKTLNGQPQRWNTKATGITISQKFRHLMRKLIFDLAKLESTGKRSFVDTSMQSNDPMTEEAYRKAVFQQQLFLRNTTHHVITKVSHSAME